MGITPPPPHLVGPKEIDRARLRPSAVVYNLRVVCLHAPEAVCQHSERSGVRFSN